MAIVKFGEVASRLNIHVDQANTDLEYYIGGEHIESREFMIHSKAPIKGATIGYQFQFGFEPGDILFMTKNPHLRKASMVDFRGLCSIATFVIRTNDPKLLLQEYLLIEMQSDRFWNYLEEHKSGGVNYFINWGTLSNYEFDLPPLYEQKILADKLWAAYRLKESYKKLLAATDEMVKSRFIEMFKDVRESKSLCAICRPKQWPTIPTKDFTDDGYLVYGANGIIGHYSQYNHEHSTILMACRGASCGAINISQPKSYITGNAMCMDDIDDNVLFDFLAYFLSNYDYKTIITGGAQPQITVTNLQKVMVPIAPKSQQEAFGVIVKQADKSKYYN